VEVSGTALVPFKVRVSRFPESPIHFLGTDAPAIAAGFGSSAITAAGSGSGATSAARFGSGATAATECHSQCCCKQAPVSATVPLIHAVDLEACDLEAGMWKAGVSIFLLPPCPT